MKAIVLLMAAATLAAKDKPEADPISDHLRFEIAVLERDFVAAKAPYEAALAALRTKVDAAQALCATRGQVFSADLFACAEKPKPPEPQVKPQGTSK
jgi:hypothetical protein